MNKSQRAGRITKRSTGRRRSGSRGGPRVGAGVAVESAPDPIGGPIKDNGTTGPDGSLGKDAAGIAQEASEDMISTRQSLPDTRTSVTHKFSVAGHEGYLTVGLHPDGRPGEIFIKMSKAGSTLSGMCQAFTRAFSLALQYGLSLEDACRRFTGMRFEPMGQTENPDIPEASSIIDYVARYLELTFGQIDRG